MEKKKKSYKKNKRRHVVVIFPGFLTLIKILLWMITENNSIIYCHLEKLMFSPKADPAASESRRLL